MHPKEILDFYGFRPKKSLGQNFLFDDHILERLADAVDLSAEDEVLEIGPGLGSLTAVLAKRAAAVTAVELDGRFIPILENLFAGQSNVNIVHGDILRQNIGDWFQRPYKVVANVPYYITGAIMRHLLSSTPKPSKIAITVQKEVAQRITAVPPQMSLMAVSVQFYGQAKIVETIKAGAFWPRPDVDSAVVSVNLSVRSDGVDEKTFFRLVKVGFSQKRKQLQKNLRALAYDRAQIIAVLTESDIEPSRRAQTLSVEEWIKLYRAFEHAKIT